MTKNVDELILACLEQKLAFAIYKKPNDTTHYLVISKNKKAENFKIDFEKCKPGFVMAAFDNQTLPYYISADIFAKINDSQVEILEDLRTDTKISSIIFSASDSGDTSQKYIAKASIAKERIINGECSKIVLSRIKKFGNIKGNNYFEKFNVLCHAYPSAFVSLVSLPWLGQIWLGASPEILVRQNAEKQFQTVALAGTQKSTDQNGNKKNTIDALWSQKEIEEQAIVGRYIIDCLKSIRVREFTENGPKTMLAGNLLHLISTYSINTKEIDFPNFSSKMLDLLHPTPAVCGMPKGNAEEIIKEIEGYPREFYGGYLGPVNINNESDLFVNIRCLKIEDKIVYGYAGGGLTADSNLEKEFQETELKLETISIAFK